MMKSHWLKSIVHVLFWVLSGWLITQSFSIQSQELEMVNGKEIIKTLRSATMMRQLLLCIGLSAVMFYANFWNIQRVKGKVQVKNVVVLSLGLFVAFTSIYYLIEYLELFGSLLPLPSSILWGIFIFYFAVSVAYGIGILWLHTERQRQQITLDKTAAELTLLRNQLQPHFLFNVLNNLLSMVDQAKNPRLADSLDRLSGLLRYVVYDISDQRVPVQKEIDFIRNYAELQLLRFEKDEVDFELNLTGMYNEQLIEPGIFISFIENAFKYGTEPEQKSRIDANFDLSEPKKVFFSITNPIFRITEPNHHTGIGLVNTKERLALVYPDRHYLDIRENELFEVTLEINTDEGYNSR